MTAVAERSASRAAAPDRTRRALAVAAVAPIALKLAMHVVAAAVTSFAFHRDEFLYFAKLAAPAHRVVTKRT